MSDQPIELRLAIAEARINALEKVVMEIAHTLPRQSLGTEKVWKALEKLEFAGVEVEEAASKHDQWVKKCDEH